jgi:thioredoxin 1
MATVVLTKDNFKDTINDSKIPVLVDFWAAWCGPCRMLSPILDELSHSLDGEVLIGKVDVDAETELAAAFEIMSIPTVILFKDGQMTEKIVGVRPRNYYLNAIK